MAEVSDPVTSNELWRACQAQTLAADAVYRLYWTLGSVCREEYER